VAPAVAHALHTHPTPSIVVRDVLGHGHLVLVDGLLLFVGVLLVSVGATPIRPPPLAHPARAERRLMPSGAASTTRLYGGLPLLALALQGMAALAATGVPRKPCR